jgi:hypothetical protein
MPASRFALDAMDRVPWCSRAYLGPRHDAVISDILLILAAVRRDH